MKPKARNTLFIECFQNLKIFLGFHLVKNSFKFTKFSFLKTKNQPLIKECYIYLIKDYHININMGKAEIKIEQIFTWQQNAQGKSVKVMLFRDKLPLMVLCLPCSQHTPPYQIDSALIYVCPIRPYIIFEHKSKPFYYREIGDGSK